jgi:hypothetical protein
MTTLGEMTCPDCGEVSYLMGMHRDDCLKKIGTVSLPFSQSVESAAPEIQQGAQPSDTAREIASLLRCDTSYIKQQIELLIRQRDEAADHFITCHADLVPASPQDEVGKAWNRAIAVAQDYSQIAGNNAFRIRDRYGDEGVSEEEMEFAQQAMADRIVEALKAARDEEWQQ